MENINNDKLNKSTQSFQKIKVSQSSNSTSIPKDPHIERRRYLLKTYPQVKSLFGPRPITAVFVFIFVGVQIGISYWLKDSSYWIVIPMALFVGALLDHGLWSLIHECTHNLVFKSNTKNILLQIFANIPHIFPSAMTFRKFHLIHHSHFNDKSLDADIPLDIEVKLVGNSTWRKALWLSLFFLFQSLRAFHNKKVKIYDRWTFLNYAVQAVFVFTIIYFFGITSFVYLLVSSIFAIGLHPVGARWIQEHFEVRPGQKTYSYYGPLNLVSFNVGYHNEHHDIPNIACFHLPKLRKLAPELYESIYYHTSWTRLLIQFITDKNLSLKSRFDNAN